MATRHRDEAYGDAGGKGDGKDGLLINNGNVLAFAYALAYMMNNDDVRHEMAVEALNKVNRYKIDSIMEQWRLLFESVCGDGEKGGLTNG